MAGNQTLFFVMTCLFGCITISASQFCDAEYMTPIPNGGDWYCTSNYFGGYCSWSCAPGYYLEGESQTNCAVDNGDGTADWDNPKPTCLDINECIDGTSNCDVNANCTNTDGSFTCICKDGFTGDGITCSAANPCANQGYGDIADPKTCYCYYHCNGDGTGYQECCGPDMHWDPAQGKCEIDFESCN